MSLLIELCIFFGCGTLILSTFTGILKEMYNKFTLWMLVNIAFLIALVSLFIDAYINNYLTAPLAFFALFGGIISLFRLKGNKNLIVGDSTMPPIEKTRVLDYAFRDHRLVHILMCNWFLIGALVTSSGASFYGFLNHEYSVSLLGFFALSASLYETIIKKGYGIIKGSLDIFTGCLLIFISDNVQPVGYQAIIILTGSFFIGSGLYLGFSNRFERSTEHSI